ncbi:MAG: STAS domain-containing protein [Defluviitaleaceae bacterium]|nr:STAS domain-containing protein [Defluviitaleaceae bacterium]
MDDFTMTLDKSHAAGRKFNLRGRISANEANILQHKLEHEFLGSCPNMVLNMRQVTFIGSGGLRVLLMFYKKAKAGGGSFYLESPSENVVNVLGMTALDQMLLR